MSVAPSSVHSWVQSQAFPQDPPAYASRADLGGSVAGTRCETLASRSHVPSHAPSRASRAPLAYPSPASVARRVAPPPSTVGPGSSVSQARTVRSRGGTAGPLPGARSIAPTRRPPPPSDHPSVPCSDLWTGGSPFVRGPPPSESPTDLGSAAPSTSRRLCVDSPSCAVTAPRGSSVKYTVETEQCPDGTVRSRETLSVRSRGSRKVAERGDGREVRRKPTFSEWLRT